MIIDIKIHQCVLFHCFTINSVSLTLNQSTINQNQRNEILKFKFYIIILTCVFRFFDFYRSFSVS